jgi:hypothetical protein
VSQPSRSNSGKYDPRAVAYVADRIVLKMLEKEEEEEEEEEEILGVSSTE